MSLISVSGDEDRWYLLARVSATDRPLVVRAREMGPDLKEFADRFPLLAVRGSLGPEVLADMEMPIAGVSELLYEWEDRLVALVTQSGLVAYQLAVVTGEGRRDIYMAASDPSALETCIESAWSPEFMRVDVQICPETEAIWPLILPTELDKQLDADRAVMDSLSSHGDDGIASRKMEFWFYGAKVQLEHLLAELKRLDFAFESWLDDPTGMIVSRNSPATPEAFELLTPQLLELAASHHVEYDGWETLVLDAPAQAKPREPSFLRRLMGFKDN